MIRRTYAVAAALCLLGSACGDDAESASPAVSTTTSTTIAVTSTSTTTTTTVPEITRPYNVLQSVATYVDETRVTAAGSQTDELPTRSLDVWIDLPDTSELRPLLIFAHGLTGHPRTHELLRTHLAAEGFVVVSPAFPLTNTDVPGGWGNAGDTPEQINDITFLIDSVLADPEFASRIDAERIGMIGHSLGGFTTAGAALASTGDQRISAAVVMSAGYGEARDDVSVMTVHGDLDPLVPYASGENSYQLLSGRRIFVTLVGGGHIEGILDDGTDWGVALRGLAAAFFAHELDAEDGQVADIDTLPLNDVTVEAGTAAGALDNWRDYFSS